MIKTLCSSQLASFLINLKVALYILTLTKRKMILVIIILYLNSHSNLNLLRVVQLHPVDYLSTNNVFNSFQSAFIIPHSTETTLLHSSWFGISSNFFKLYLLNRSFYVDTKNSISSVF